MQLMALLGNINHMISKAKLRLNVRIIDNITSDFVFDHLFMLNFSNRTGHTNSKQLGIIYHHTKVKVIRSLVMSQLKINFFDGKNQFSVKTQASARLANFKKFHAFRN